MKSDWHVSRDADRKVLKSCTDTIALELGLTAPRLAEKVLDHTLKAIRDSVPLDVAILFAAELPYAVRCLYFADWEPSTARDDFAESDAVLERIGEGCARFCSNDPREIADAVLRSLRSEVRLDRAGPPDHEPPCLRILSEARRV